MALYMFLAIFAVLMALICLGILIYSLVKKKKTTGIVSLSLLVVFAMTTVYCIYKFASRGAQYLSSEEFQKDVKDKGEVLGKTAGNTVSSVSKGMAATLNDSSITALANRSAVIVGKVVKAVYVGVDTGACQMAVLTDKSVTDAGLAIGQVKSGVGKSGNGISIFVDFNKAFKGKLRLTAFDDKGAKMDVAEATADQPAGGGKVLQFDFKDSPPGLTGYSILSKM